MQKEQNDNLIMYFDRTHECPNVFLMENKIQTIGIIGGGQLGMMMTEAAHQLGFKVIVLDPTAACPCSFVADEMIVAQYDDDERVGELCHKSDVITYEFENVPFTSVKKWKEQYNIPQGEMPLYLSQHRVIEKQAAESSGAVVGAYCAVNNNDELQKGIKKLVYPVVLKTCSGGYDGKGQVVLRDDSNMEKAMQLVGHKECILEKFIPFDCEISVIVNRSIHGELTTLPITKNIHKDNILFMSIAPAPVSETVIEKATTMAINMMQSLNFVGTLAIEMFVVNEDVLFNEMAPRPHNSGHYSIEGCLTSQFEQHIRAIAGMPLGKTDLLQPTIMVNYLGQHITGIKELMTSGLPNMCIHDYHKAIAAHNRKMGHVTFCNYSQEEVEEFVESYWK
ncbi:MAG: 5-(carboxyamino)imidazole ribonucleotide synthase [Bacteroidales bacterium]|jgi:5-(carboxyamino)imidazole ribonucleotide synthase|nr:5-(carboxyamino)imidazole ribonucleotide synthase [Bacteroidales bacterium]